MTGECEYELFPEYQDPPMPAEFCRDPTYPGEPHCPNHTKE